MVIIISGMGGIGKTTTAKTLHDELNIPVFYESVEDNKILPLFYITDEEEQDRRRYPFLLQLNFLTTRFRDIKKAYRSTNAILDRCIFEDEYFAKKNHGNGKIADIEFEIYESIFHEMVDSIHNIGQGKPDLMIYLTGSFETVMKRIKQRARDFEVSDKLREYFYYLWKDYDDFIFNYYKESPVLVVNMDEKDVNFNEQDKRWLIEEISKYKS